MKTSMNKIMWGLLIVIALSVTIYAQGNGWNAGDDWDYGNYTEFCYAEQRMEFRETIEYNYTQYILCDKYENDGKLSFSKRFIQLDVNSDDLYECNLNQQQEMCLGGVSFDLYKCYPNRENRDSPIKCKVNNNKGEWWRVRNSTI